MEAFEYTIKKDIRNNAIVVISGDVTMAQVKPLAEKIYGALPDAMKNFEELLAAVKK